MANVKHNVNNTSNKIAGKMKETAGKATNNEKLELKGKIQFAKADIKGKVEDITDKKSKK